jgi:hypothetical protein
MLTSLTIPIVFPNRVLYSLTPEPQAPKSNTTGWHISIVIRVCFVIRGGHRKGGER